MKNDRMKHALERELAGVHVRHELKQRILAEASASRAPVKKTGFSLRPLAIAVAVMMTVGLGAGLIALRSEKPDLSATPLSAGSAAGSVWAGGEGLSHGRENCGDQADMRRTTPADARARGLKACSQCFEMGDKAVEDLVWTTQYGSVYHAAYDCSGMENAFGLFEIEAETLGRVKCGICLGGDVIETWPELAEPTLTPRPTLTPKTGQFQMLPWQEPGQGEIVYAFDTPEPTPEPTVDPLATSAAETTIATPEFAQEPMDGDMPTPMPTVAPDEMMVKSTPEPTVSPMPMPTSEPSHAPEEACVKEEIFWMTQNGEYYHADEHCSGMENAGAVSRSEAMQAGKKICEICTERILWTDDGGKSCHLAKNCGGMEGAEMIVLAPGDTSYSVGCLVCSAGGMPVWVTENGTFHHLDEHCSGMENALQIMESEALAEKKQACPVCMYGQGEAETDVLWVWVKENEDSLYYHTDAHCSGMEGAFSCDVVSALGLGKLPCPVCAKQFAEAWVTQNNHVYHLSKDCMGIVGAEKITGREAVDRGLILCQECHRQLSSAMHESAE